MGTWSLRASRPMPRFLRQFSRPCSAADNKRAAVPMGWRIGSAENKIREIYKDRERERERERERDRERERERRETEKKKREKETAIATGEIRGREAAVVRDAANEDGWEGQRRRKG